jgi:tetratricopeptide (TPR) repeat protein
MAILVCGIPVSAQSELVPVSDVSGGSSVFVFRSAAKAAPRKFVSKTRTVRTKSQRIETARKVSKQYVALAKVAPRRTRTASVDPDNLPPAVKTMPKDEASRLFAGVGEYYMDRDEFDRAIEFFRESVQLDGANTRATGGLSEALALRGNDLLIKDNAAVARKFFEEALRYNPKNSPAYFGLAEVFADLDKAPEAVANYENALANDKALTEIYVPLGILYYEQGEIAKSESMLTKALAISPNDAQTQYFLGLIRYSQNRDQDALTAFQKAKSLDPNNPEIYFHSGETQARNGKNTLAIEDFKKATMLRANYFDAWLGLGSAYFEMDKYPEAIAAYKQAVRLKNDNAEAYVNLGDAYRLSGDYNGAEANYSLATTFIARSKDFSNEDAADIYSKIGFVIAKQCAINMKKGMGCKWPAAVRALEKATTLSQSSIDQANLGWAYYNVAQMDMTAKRDADAKANLEKAKASLQKAVAANPQFVEAPLLNLGVTLNDLGDYPGAVDALTKVVNKQPKWVFAINELGIAYRKQNNFKEAANQFRKAIAKDDKYVVAYYNLGEAEFRAGNLGEAKKAYDKLKKLGAINLATQLELISGGAIRG